MVGVVSPLEKGRLKRREGLLLPSLGEEIGEGKVFTHKGRK